MTGTRKPTVIILESNKAVREHMAAILTGAGWDVTMEQTAKQALERLSSSKSTIFTLFITNFKLPKMQGDDILQKVKAISPLTCRMLVIPSDKPELLIRAINKAQISACIITPFNDQDLTDQARICFHQFKYAVKRQRLKRVTIRQNKKMFDIAQKLKKKDGIYQKLIDEKKAQQLMLRSKKRKAENDRNLDINISLASLVEHKQIPPSPGTFKDEFTDISKIVKDLFDQITKKNNSDPIPFNLEDILSHDRQENKSLTQELIEKILKTVFILATDKKNQGQDILAGPDDSDTDTQADPLESYFEISISETRTKATIKKIRDFDKDQDGPNLSGLLDLLKQNQISYGILDDEAIETWISKSCMNKIVIARGEDPVPGRDGKIKFHFKTDFTNPGKINEDGSIDFRDRGNIPQISKDALLAIKTPPQKGQPGISVSGTPLPVDEVIDPVFIAGPGTLLSEDECSILAAIDGQPHLDALGSISVNPELTIPGDVDFETGNIDFKGNIIVKGTIKEGFIVKGINLTAMEIEGATIDLTGDLNISAGITEASISTHGNIYAKFINHSKIMGFGNLVVSKEIIDSTIKLSGSCINPAGHIISSQISAKMGIEAGKIGTTSSQPVKLKLGVDEHIELLKKQVDDRLESTVYKTGLLKDEIKNLENEDQELYLQISEKAQIQDQSQLKIKKLKHSGDPAKSQQTSQEIKKLVKNAKEAEQQLNKIFETQDNIADKIEQIRSRINSLEEKNKQQVIEKKALKEFAQKDRPQPVLTVAQTISQDSIINGPNTSMILKDDTSRCKIQELTLLEEDTKFYDMTVSDL